MTVTFAGLKERFCKVEADLRRLAQVTPKSKWHRIALLEGEAESHRMFVGELEALEQQVQALRDEVKAIASGLPHEQSEDPERGMIPNINCAHCQLLLTVEPKLTALLGKAT